MLRTFAAAAVWALAVTSAHATCAQGGWADATAVVNAPQSFAGRCLSLRGVLSLEGTAGAILTPATGRALDAPPGHIAIVFEDGVGPDLATRARYAAILGRVLTYDELGGAAKARDGFVILVSSYSLLNAPPPH